MRARLLPTLLTTLVIFGLTEPAWAAPPNVVVILSDDQGWQDYSFMGHPHIRTPRIDRLAGESTVFTRGYVPSSLCRPSIACLITGLYPHQHKIVGNDPRPNEVSGLSKAELRKTPEYQKLRRQFGENLNGVPTLPRLFTSSGYLAHQSGKWWEGDHESAGFTHGMTLGGKSPAGRHGDEGLIIGRQTMQPVLDFMDEAKAKSKPFLVFYAPMMPHLPHNPPDRLLSKYRDVAGDLKEAKYWAMCEWFDETVGQLLDAIDDRGLRENTVVVYMVDNGWTNPPGTPNGPYGGPRGKTSPYDGGLRTPVMVRWPGHTKPHRDDTTLVSSIDVLPTLLAATGIARPAGLPGVNLLDDAALARRDAIFGSTFTHDATVPTVPSQTLEYRWIASGEWKLIVPNQPGPEHPEELFHITADPHEERNLAADQPERVAQLKSRLDQWWTP
jgi:arylsulfatase A-like enzyme